MFEMIDGLGQRHLQYLITGDKSWIYWDNHCRGMWAVDRDDIQPNSKHIISSEKTMISAYLCLCGFVSIEFVPDGEKYNSLFFTEIQGIPKHVSISGQGSA
jgi:hypothetical protein